MSDAVAGRHLDRASRMLRSHNNPQQAAVEHYALSKHSLIEARVELILS
jgi:hypothetical protein